MHTPLIQNPSSVSIYTQESILQISGFICQLSIEYSHI